MRVAVYSAQRYERDFLSQHPQLFDLAPDAKIDYLWHRLDITTVPLAKGAEAVSVFVNDILDENVIKMLAESGTKVLLLRCAGFNQVDLNAAAKYKIPVLRVPAYSPYAVAEFAVALLLTAGRKTHKAYNRTRESNFSLTGLMGFDVHGKTIGICGTGKIGRLFAKIMLGFGTRVIAYDVYESQEAKDMGVEYVKLDDLFAQSDIISLHCPLLPSTRHMINTDSVSKMKKGVLLINTSRGELVEMDALIDGLRTKKIGACGMDVVDGEAELFFADHTGEILENDKITTLLSFPNVVLTPHIAFCTDTALTNIWTTTFKNLVEFSSKSNEDKFTNQVLMS